MKSIIKQLQYLLASSFDCHKCFFTKVGVGVSSNQVYGDRTPSIVAGGGSHTTATFKDIRISTHMNGDKSKKKVKENNNGDLLNILVYTLEIQNAITFASLESWQKQSV